MATASVVAAWWAPGLPWWAAVPAALLLMLARRPWAAVAAVVLLVGMLAARAEAGLRLDGTEQVVGVVTLLADPQPARVGAGFSADVRLDADGRRARLITTEQMPSTLAAGSRVEVRGVLSPWPERRDWALSRHLVGRLRVRQFGASAPMHPAFRAANAVHDSLAAATGGWDPQLAALARGLVLGDDADQSDAMVFRFRASGLGHLTAVSGQNVAFVLAVAAPLLSRLRLRWRWAVTVMLIGGFALVTRFEPSVIRASVMAAVAATVALQGRAASGRRVVAITITVCLVGDPLLVHSVGFRLSVAATVGLVVWSGPLARRLPGPELLRTAVAATLSATVATLPFSLMLSGALPSATLPANLLAAPVAGLVMTVGVPIALVALIAPTLAAWCMWAVWPLVFWVERVAAWCSTGPFPVVSPAAAAVAVIGGGLWWFTSVSSEHPRVGPRRAGRRPGGPSSGGLGSERARSGWASFGVTLVVAALLGTWWWPRPPGDHDLGRGARLIVGGCGERVVVLTGTASAAEVAEALWRRDVRALDGVVVGVVGRTGRVAADLTDMIPTHARWSVGPLLPETTPIADAVGPGLELTGRQAVPLRPRRCH